MSKLSLSKRFSFDRFFVGEPATDQAIRLTQRRIFILPTDRGVGFAIVIFLLLLIAFVYNNNLAYLLGFLLASVFFITILHTYQSLSGLIIQKGQSQNVFAGTAAGFMLQIENPTQQARHSLQISLAETVTLSLPAHSQSQVMLYSETHQRGWHQIGTVTVASCFPFGLFRAWSPLRFLIKVLVYPKPASTQLAFPETPANQAQQGFGKQAADDFYGLQNYQPGDNLKHIDWKTYAKGLGVFTKQYGGESSAEIWLDFAYTPGYSVEDKLCQLCRWVIDAEQAGIQYGIALPGVILKPDHGLAHYQKCLDALALF